MIQNIIYLDIIKISKLTTLFIYHPVRYFFKHLIMTIFLRGLIILFFLASCSKVSKEYKVWDTYRGGPESIAYSSLDRINKTNVKQLKVAWEYHTGDITEGARTAIQCNPIIANGMMYVTSPKLKLIALDPASGTEKWTFDPFKGREGFGVNRGVIYCENKLDKRIFYSAGSWLYAINADTGEPTSSFGDNGKIDLRVGLDRDPENISAGATSPGIIYEDILIQGVTVSESYEAAPGFIRGYDVLTGELIWTFRTIPQPDEFGYETWEKDNYREVGGANVWTGFSLDKERGIVYAPTGSAAFDFYGGYRKGKNLYANSLIALDAKTGEKIWHHQLVHHDLWDYDLPAPPTLVTVKNNGREVDAVAQVTKMGMVFLFDRESGEPVFPIEERPVPQSTVPGEETWPTQPFPVKPPPFVRHKFTEEDFSNISEASYKFIKDFLKEANYGQIYTPPSLNGTVQFPGTRGGGEWGGPAFDPESGIMYVNANEVPMFIRLKRLGVSKDQALSGAQLYQLNNCSMCHGPDRTGVGAFPSLLEISRSPEEVISLLGTGKGQMPAFSNLTEEQKKNLTDYLFNPTADNEEEPTLGDLRYVHDGWNILADQDGYFGVKPPWGTLNAIDLNEGKILWKVPLGEYPELIEKGLPPTGTQNLGGPLVTKGGLIFIGATRDEKFRAFDKVTGEILWEYHLPAAGHATPSTYEVDGEQYIVIAAGGGGKVGTRSGDAYVAFKLKQ